jgi:hypothetical protein
MLALRLVRLIEARSDKLAAGLLERIRTSSRTLDYLKISEEELRQQTYDIYRHLGDWLLNKTETDIEHRYVKLGMLRYEEGVKFSDFMWAVVITKENLWRYVQSEVGVEGVLELFSEIELIRLLDQFFDRALYYAALGYERAGRSARAA